MAKRTTSEVRAPSGFAENAPRMNRSFRHAQDPLIKVQQTAMKMPEAKRRSAKQIEPVKLKGTSQPFALSSVANAFRWGSLGLIQAPSVKVAGSLVKPFRLAVRGVTRLTSGQAGRTGRSSFNARFKAASVTSQNQRASAMVAKDKPHPVPRPRADYARAVDRNAFNDAWFAERRAAVINKPKMPSPEVGQSQRPPGQGFGL